MLLAHGYPLPNSLLPMSLIDSWMPSADVTTQHAILVAARAVVVYDALLTTDFGSHPLVALLMGLRSLPAALFAPRATLHRLRSSRQRSGQPLKVLLSGDFVLLEAQPPDELVLGLTGRFWTPSGGLIPTEAATFRALPPPGTARAAWGFRLVPVSEHVTRLVTETRVRCADPATLRQFRRYWRIVSPGSGLIRWAVLRQIRQQAEAAAR